MFSRLSSKSFKQLAAFKPNFHQTRQLHSYFDQGNVGVAVLRKKDMEHVHHTDPGHDTEVWKREELFGEGNQDATQVPFGLDQAVGKQRVEYQALLDGKDPYYGLTSALQVSDKGTKESPIMVVSPDEDRYVGCIGHKDHEHMLVWFQVTEDGHKYWEYGHNRCSECGNTYKLDRIDIPYPTIN